MSDETPGAAVPAGTRAAGCCLDEQIGRGGTAVVCRAYDLQPARQVALKVLNPVLPAWAQSPLTPPAGPGPATGVSFPPEPPPGRQPADRPYPPARPAGPHAPGSSRPWWRSRMVAGLVALFILGMGGTAVAITHRARPAAGLTTTRLAPPGCVRASSTAPRLAGIDPQFLTLTGMPFAVAVTGHGHWSFVSTGVGRPIEVLRAGSGLAPVLAHRILVPAPVHGEAITPTGTRGGRILVANSGVHRSGLHHSGLHGGRQASLAVINAAAALAGRPALLGMIGARILPRECAVKPGGRTTLVTNSASHQLEAVNVSQLG